MDMKALDRRIKTGVREIKISPLFEKGKIYNIDKSSPLYYQEDLNGTMRPDTNHCWVSWEARWKDGDTGEYHWSKEVYYAKTLEEAEEARQYLAPHII